MSNLAMAIQHLLDQNDQRERAPRNLAELASLADIAPSVLTRLATGQRCKSKVLAQILSYISPDIADKQEIATAHLRDEINRGGLDPSEFLVLSAKKQGSSNPLTNVPAYLEKTFTILANESLANDDLREILVKLGEMVSKYHGRQKKISKYPTTSESNLKVAEDKNPPKRPRKRKKK